jgi:CDP-glucose 4,6-dehydratase
VFYGEAPVIRSDGQLVRDYLHVDDAVDAYLLAAEALSKGTELAGQAINVSYEQPMTVIEIVNRLLVRMGRTDLQPVILGEASNEIPQQYLLSERARRMLGWTPRVGVDAGLAQTIAWYQAFLSGGSPQGREARPAAASLM